MEFWLGRGLGQPGSFDTRWRPEVARTLPCLASQTSVQQTLPRCLRPRRHVAVFRPFGAG
ncbi:hypothetical protein D9X30_1154 [Cupriavidus sp. U2]|nr:hypothetical protein D9X30_1154 [Cupriavidus sp. U2]